MSEIKRLHYFRHQFLNEKDFLDEQAYHVEMRRRLNRASHSEGIVDGLEVEKRGEREVAITPGFAIDREGREIVLADPIHRAVTVVPPAAHAFVVIAYREGFEQADHHSSAGVEGYTRVTEAPDVRTTSHHPPDDGVSVVLARIRFNEDGDIDEVERDVRRHSGLRLGHGSIHTAALADASVTAAKLAPDVRRQTGWLRVCFKPLPEDRSAAFLVGPTEAACGKEGATGSMGIPSPPGAVRITGFRMAGEINDGGIKIELYKCGWDSVRADHEKRTVLTDTLSPHQRGDGGRRAFEEMRPLAEDLDPEHHALAVRVIAQGRTSISLIAVRFEYEFRELSPTF